MEITIRPADVNDLKEILRIEEKSFPEPWSENKYIDELKYSYMYLALKEGRACGYIILRQISDEGTIMNLAVSPEFRRQGIARSLLNYIITYSKSLGIKKLFLEVRSGNNPAIKLYESCGFRTFGLRKKYYPDDDALLMSL